MNKQELIEELKNRAQRMDVSYIRDSSKHVAYMECIELLNQLDTLPTEPCEICGDEHAPVLFVLPFGRGAMALKYCPNCGRKL